MLSTLRTSARAVVMAGLVGGLALAAPTAARAQAITPEQALLNRLHAAASGTPTAFTQGRLRPASVEQAFLDGERALLNHSQATADTPVDTTVSGGSVGGEVQYPTGVRALLNRSSL